MKPKNIAILLVVVLFLIVLFQNTGVVELRLLFWRVSMSQVILVPLLVLIGFIVGFAVGKLKGGKRRVRGTGEGEQAGR